MNFSSSSFFTIICMSVYSELLLTQLLGFGVKARFILSRIGYEEKCTLGFEL